MNICIVGGGVTGTIAALYFQKYCPEWNVTMVENPNIKALPVGENLHRHTFNFFCDVVDQPWQDTMRELANLNCTIKLSGQFNDWSNVCDTWYMPFTQNSNADVLKMHNAWLATRSDQPISDYFDMVYGDVLQHVYNDTVPENYFNRSADLCCMYVDATQVSGYLRSKFKGKVVFGNVIGVKKNEDKLEHIELEDGSKIAADFFFDCSGFQRVLIKEFATFTPIETAMVDSAYVGPSKHTKDRISVSSNTMAMDHGWMFKVPMQHRNGIGYVFNSKITDIETIKASHAEHGGEAMAERRIFTWDPVQTDTSWSQNVISLGTASFWNEPLIGAALELSAKGIIHFVKYYKEDVEQSRTRYNEWFNTQRDLINIRIHAMYHYCKKDNTDFWKYVHEKSNATDIHEKFMYLVNGGFTEMLKTHPNLMWGQRDFEMMAMSFGIKDAVLDKQVDEETLQWAQEKWKENLTIAPAISSNDFYVKLKEAK